MKATAPPQPALTQLVLKPTVYCFHRCPYCDPRQDYYRDLVAARKTSLKLVSSGESSKRINPGHMPLGLALRTIEEAAALGMRSMQLSGGDPLLYPHLVELIRAGARHPGVFVFMNSVGTGVTPDRAREIIEAGLGAWNFSVDTLDAAKYERLRGVRGALPKVLQAIEIVSEAAADYPEFCINYMTVITRHNYRDLPELIRHCVDTGVASVYLMNVYGDTLEDMHYSFVLGSRNLPMVPIPSLDRAEVPAAPRIQIHQAARWFFGPARFRGYLRDPRTKQGPRARLLALSALAICLEWLSCAVVPALLALALWWADGLLRTLTVGFIVVYGLQLLATEAFAGSPAGLRDRVGRVLAYPIVATLFGVGGIIGAAQLLRGGTGAGKTERLGV